MAFVFKEHKKPWMPILGVSLLSILFISKKLTLNLSLLLWLLRAGGGGAQRTRV